MTGALSLSVGQGLFFIHLSLSSALAARVAEIGYILRAHILFERNCIMLKFPVFVKSVAD
jgi:hypothetical protein